MDGATSNRQQQPQTLAGDRQPVAALEAGFRLHQVEVRPLAATIAPMGSGGGDDREPIRIGLKAMKVLLALAERTGEEVAREELFEAVWPMAEVGDEVLTVAISTLRRALGDDAREPRFIQTVPGVGYRLIAAPRPLPPTSSPAAIPRRPGPARRNPVRRRSGLRAAALFLLAAGASAALVRLPADPTATGGSAAALPAALATGRPAVAAAAGSPPLPADLPPAVRQAILQGRYRVAERGSGHAELEAARRALEQAVERSPEVAAVHLTLAELDLRLGHQGHRRPRAAFQRAAAAAGRALALDPANGRAHAIEAAALLLGEWDFAAARAGLARALELAPDDPEVRLWAARYLTVAGEFDGALLHLQRRLELAPEAYVMPEAAAVLVLARRQEQALDRLLIQLEAAPDSAELQCQLARTYGLLGRYDEGLAAYRQARLLDGASEEEIAWLEPTFEAEGVAGLCAQELAKLEEMARAGWPVSAVDRAEALIHLDDPDAAFALLEEAYRQRDPALLFLPRDPRFDRLRSDPRFDALVGRIGLPG